jgi:hypothetical protein
MNKRIFVVFAVASLCCGAISAIQVCQESGLCFDSDKEIPASVRKLLAPSYAALRSSEADALVSGSSVLASVPCPADTPAAILSTAVRNWDKVCTSQDPTCSITSTSFQNGTNPTFVAGGKTYALAPYGNLTASCSGSYFANGRSFKMCYVRSTKPVVGDLSIQLYWNTSSWTSPVCDVIVAMQVSRVTQVLKFGTQTTGVFLALSDTSNPAGFLCSGCTNGNQPGNFADVFSKLAGLSLKDCSTGNLSPVTVNDPVVSFAGVSVNLTTTLEFVSCFDPSLVCVLSGSSSDSLSVYYDTNYANIIGLRMVVGNKKTPAGSACPNPDPKPSASSSLSVSISSFASLAAVGLAAAALGF